MLVTDSWIIVISVEVLRHDSSRSIWTQGIGVPNLHMHMADFAVVVKDYDSFTIIVK